MMPAGSMRDVFGDGESSKEPEPAGAEDGESEYPPEYTEAYQEYADSPSAETFWRAVEACTASKDGGGLAILLGKGKGKK